VSEIKRKLLNDLALGIYDARESIQRVKKLPLLQKAAEAQALIELQHSNQVKIYAILRELIECQE
jgi:hypothetical protein